MTDKAPHASPSGRSELGFTLPQLLKVMVEKGASDLHVTVGQAPLLRIDGTMIPLKLKPLQPDDTKSLLYEVLDADQRREFEEELELDFPYTLKNVARFRGNLFVQQGAVGAVFRHIPQQIRSFDELGLPPVLAEICNRSQGLVLITGATGSGKSTTMAAMIDKLNTEQRLHIVTIEDPIEFVHQHKRSLVNQRQVGTDTKSFGAALKHVLRQDPDVVLVGEMRDLETIETSLTIAETGHLVFGTLHTNSAIQSINRVIDVFPPHQQTQVRQQLAMSLLAVVTQTLLPNQNTPGRCLAMEIMVPNPAIRNLIREDKLHQVYSAMQSGQTESGMQTLNQAIIHLLRQGLVSLEEAFAASNDLEELRKLVSGARGHG